MKNYEVKADFFEKFISQDKNNKSFFKKISIEKYVFDLRGFINKELSNLNIKNIDNIEMDTFSEIEFFIAIGDLALTGSKITEGAYLSY